MEEEKVDIFDNENPVVVPGEKPVEEFKEVEIPRHNTSAMKIPQVPEQEPVLEPPEEPAKPQEPA